MSSHIGRAYLTNCLKVPIDPCSNCPAPTYSRPKLYLGRSTATPNTCSNPEDMRKHCSSVERGTKWSCGGIRSLAKLYDSIPDYRDLHHLSGEEFYSTLDTLRSTCRELKVKTSCLSSEDRCSTTTSTSLTSNSQLAGSRSKKCKKTKKKKKSNGKQSAIKCEEVQESDFIQDFLNKQKQENCPESVVTKPRQSSLCKSSKQDLEQEVECFKNSLKEFEAEFKRSLSSLNRNESRSFTKNSTKDVFCKPQGDNEKISEKVPVRSNFTSQLRERLRKSLSFNDLHSITEPAELIELRMKNKTLEHLSFKGDTAGLQDPTNLSNYFVEKSKSETTGIPKIIVNSPNSTDQSSDRLQGKKKSKQKSNKKEEYKMPFTIFDLDSNSKKEGSIKHSTPSPVHPVARPNLAATLRVESSKKKVKELKNNCTYHDSTPQFDWEVRKTPAWKTLSFNETHKEILQLRLATRKAEQALQQREYELNMELMRQRVKSAPLLLEGPTYWGPHVGKLSHACQKEGRRHMCQSNQQRSRRKKHTSRSLSCRRTGFLTSSLTMDGDTLDTATNTYRVQTESRASMAQKLNTLRKIYGGDGTKSQSRNSNHSTNTQQSLKSQMKRNSSRMQRHEEKSYKSEGNFGKVELDSGDELSSLDRAFL
ncbi:uncharacterized protein LOC111682904 [Lucilia cuprina]|uniref:uncharacterized protein LOC111682904 n=1 Tax=Lucilia cuprina TaxID=7375 RepID=UPI001F055BC8|nr:uncharacterized protein LOC111682904 [Lucilia cuprina]